MMSKNKYFVDEYDDGELLSTTYFDDFNSALKFYAMKWKWGYSARLFRNVLDLDGNTIKTERFEYTWK